MPADKSSQTNANTPPNPTQSAQPVWEESPAVDIPYPNDAPPVYSTEPPPMRVVAQPEPERTLYQWSSPSRPYKKRSRDFYTTIAAFIFLLTIILFIAKEFLLIGVIASLAFLAYVLASVEPETVTHYLTNKGIRTGNKLYRWDTLGRFWLDQRWKQSFYQVETPLQFPGQITLLIGEGDKEIIEKILSQYVIKEKPDPTWSDRAAKWLQQKVPLEADDE